LLSRLVVVTLLVAFPFSLCMSRAQQEAPMPKQSGMGGNATGGTFAPVYDSEKRPITAGGTVDSGTVVFEDITRSAGP